MPGWARCSPGPRSSGHRGTVKNQKLGKIVVCKYSRPPIYAQYSNVHSIIPEFYCAERPHLSVGVHDRHFVHVGTFAPRAGQRGNQGSYHEVAERSTVELRTYIYRGSTVVNL